MKKVELDTRTPIATRAKRAVALAAVAGFAALSPMTATAKSHSGAGLQAGSLVCKGKGGWGAIIASKKTFRCVFSSANGGIKGVYEGTVRKFGLDIGVTGDTTMVWVVIGPASMVGKNYKPGALDGQYVGAGVEASAGVGIGANALVGGSKDPFTLQPVSVQVQTGISLAAAIQHLNLKYVGPLES